MDFSKLEKYLDNLEKDYGVPGYDLIVRKDHETVFRRMGGYSDYRRTVPVTGNDLYIMYSATKVITMTAAMQLIEQGGIGLDDPVTKYLPEFAGMEVADPFALNQWPPQIPTLADPHHPAKTPITLRMLMTMTAGLNYNITGEPIMALKEASGGRATTRQMMAAIAEMPLLFEPGTHYSYSLGHDVIAGVIEVVTGQTFGEYLKEHIFDPLGVRDAYFHLDDALRNRLTAQYAADMETGEIRPAEQTNAYCLTDCYESGGAGLISCTEDYARLADALACGGEGMTGNRILKPETVEIIKQNLLGPASIEDLRVNMGRIGYGYGVGMQVFMDPEVAKSSAPAGVFGWDGAAGSAIQMDTASKRSFVFTMHVRNMGIVYFDVHPHIRDIVFGK